MSAVVAVGVVRGYKKNRKRKHSFFNRMSPNWVAPLEACCAAPTSFCGNITKLLTCDFYVPCCMWSAGSCQALAADSSDVCAPQHAIAPLMVVFLVLAVTPVLFTLLYLRLRKFTCLPSTVAAPYQPMTTPHRHVTLDEALAAHRADELDMDDIQNDPPDMLIGASLHLVIAALDAGAPACKILDELYDGHRFLRRFSPEESRMSIISYRCIKSESDKWTLDECAFLSAVASARAFAIDFLWLDSWAYRKTPYAHADFWFVTGGRTRYLIIRPFRC